MRNSALQLTDACAICIVRSTDDCRIVCIERANFLLSKEWNEEEHQFVNSSSDGATA